MLYRRDRRSSTARRGAAAAELTICLTLLTFLTVAGTDFSRLFNAYLTITSGARNGALYGCVNATHSTNTDGIRTAALADMGGMSSTPAVSSATGTDANGNPTVSVTVTSTFTTLVTYPGVPSTMNLSRTVQMRVSQNIPD
jgi:Flp pilus assembly protein TadG